MELVKERTLQLAINTQSLRREITKRKKAEATLRESEAKYRTLLESLPQKIFLKDRNSVYISCSKNYAKDLKIKPEEIAGKTDYDFHPRELAEKLGVNVDNLVATIERFNKLVEEGEDTDFGRGEFPWAMKFTGDRSYPNPNMGKID